jgi:hypothetical protein
MEYLQSSGSRQTLSPASPICRAVMLVIMYVEMFKTDVIVFTGNVILYLTSHWQIIVNIRVSSLILTISLRDIKGKMPNLAIIYNS